MDVYVIRHGEAAPATAGAGDHSRRLAPEGREQAAGTGAGLRALGIGLDRLFTSPLIRARETAELLAQRLGAPAPEPFPPLAPGQAPETLLGELAAAGAERVALVGHEPALGHLLTLATSGAVTRGIRLRPASVARLEFESPPRPGAGILRWLLSAEQLLRIAGAEERGRGG